MSQPCSKNVTIPGLGKPFRLGSLYDCRNEQLITGVTLWDSGTLKEHMVEETFERSNFQVKATNKVSEKTDMLEVSASMKLSLLCGLINVEGSGKYLRDSHSSTLCERVTLKYQMTTRYEQLTMEHLAKGKIEHPEVTSSGRATHVVTGIKYGGEAYLVFERNISEQEKKTKVEGKMKALIKKIPTVDIDGKGELNLSDKEKEIAESFSCQFYGDCILPQNPSSFKNAVMIYKELPKYLRENGGKVPMEVNLEPLSSLDSDANKLIKEINSSVLQNTTDMLENLAEVDEKCRQLLHQCNKAEIFVSVEKGLNTFKKSVAEYLNSLKGDLSVLLPKVRSGEENESALLEILNSYQKSPFFIDELHEWVEEKKTEIIIYSQYLQTLPGVKICRSGGEFAALTLDPQHAQVFCLTFERPIADYAINLMLSYQSEKQTWKKTANEDNLEGRSQLCDRVNSKNAVELVKSFHTFYIENKEKTGFTFGVSELVTDTKKSQAHIQVYKDGTCIERHFIPPLRPEKLEVVENAHDAIVLKWLPPKTGSVSAYEVGYSIKGSQSFKAAPFDSSEHYKLTGLNPGIRYVVKVRALCHNAHGPWSDSCSVVTRPCEPPGELKLELLPPVMCHIRVSWHKPSSLGPLVKFQRYILQVSCIEDKTSEDLMVSAEKCSETIRVEPNKTYGVSIIADCGQGGCSLASESSKKIFTKVASKDITKVSLVLKSHAIKRVDTKQREHVYLLPMAQSQPSSSRIRQLKLGRTERGCEEKVIMMLGATGSGKTTLINGLVNYVLGVDWKDTYRFKLIDESYEKNIGNQAKSQTSMITSYKLNHQKGFRVPYTLTLIDTPGFGDTEGIKRDEEITQQIKEFFTTQGTGGLDHLDAIGFVVQSSLARLTVTQQYIFDQVLSLFGRDMSNNIFMLLTFADGQEPQVLSALGAAKIQYHDYYKFNNSVLYADPKVRPEKSEERDSDEDSEEESFDEMFWKMGRTSFKKFLKALSQVETKSLLLTKEVLRERETLTTSIDGINKDIRLGLSKLEELKQTIEQVKNHNAEIERSKDFKIIVEVEKTVKEQIPRGNYITNCTKCNRTCHYPCGIKLDSQKSGCAAMDSSGNCARCPTHCNWQVHANFEYQWKFVKVKEEKTSEELYKKYKEAGEKKVTAKDLITNIFKEFEDVQDKVTILAEQITKSLARLGEIALKPDPLTTSEYVDLLIENEKNNAEEGWQDRLRHLTELKMKMDTVHQVIVDREDPFMKGFTEVKKLRAQGSIDTEEGEKSLLKRLKNWLGRTFGSDWKF